jgi:hypothetical protein
LLLQDAFTGMNWVNLTANADGKVAGFVDWGWAIGACSKSSCDGLNLPEQAIFATMYEHAGDWDTAWDPDVHFVRSDDWFKTIKQKVRVVMVCRERWKLGGWWWRAAGVLLLVHRRQLAVAAVWQGRVKAMKEGDTGSTRSYALTTPGCCAGLAKQSDPKGWWPESVCTAGGVNQSTTVQGYSTV